jgi:hypothetical protein
MMLLWFVGLLATHWVADFVLQTHWQAANKSHDNIALSEHVFTYTFCLMAYVALVIDNGPMGFYFVMLNGACHWATDWCTSRWTSKLWREADAIWDATNEFNPHNFFVVVGLDQLIHQATLAGTLWWMFR